MNVDCSSFMTSTPTTVLESRNCKHCVNNSLLCCFEANSIPICHDHLEKILLFFFIIGDESVEFLKQFHTSEPCRSPLSTAEFSLYLVSNPHSRTISLVEV